MNVDFTKSFNKQFKKLPRKLQERAKAAVTLFLEDMETASQVNRSNWKIRLF